MSPAHSSIDSAIQSLEELVQQAIQLAADGSTSVQDFAVPSPWVPPRHTSVVIDLEEDYKPRRRRRPHSDPVGDEPELRRHSHHVHLGYHTKQNPIARKWETFRKRVTATVACINTGLVGFVVGIYAGMVPRIQYQLADQHHYIIEGNIYLYIGLAVSTFISWPLPLLHGRKPYIIAAFGLALPLLFPQAVIATGYRSPTASQYRVGLLISRCFTGLALGLAHINSFTALLDLFGASLMSNRPHQELVAFDDIRRDGGGMGLWLGLWSWSFIASLSIGFVAGAGVIEHLSAEWGFYVTIIILASGLVLNIIAPETRRSAFRRSFRNYVGPEEKSKLKEARGEVKLHISTTGPQFWWEEVWAGVVLSKRMFFQWGFSVIALYVGWIYAQIVLVIVLLGALLSRDYGMRPKYIGAGVSSIAIGALLATPLSKAGLFSRERKTGPRTDSMTFEPRVTWSSHLVRRVIFMLALPLGGLAYTLASPGIGVHYMCPIIFAGCIGFLSNLALAECNGLIMETFDTSDLQPGINSRHRLQSMATVTRRRRTNYSSFPRVTAGIFTAQSIGFLLAAAATGVGGVLTRDLGAQISIGITAGILLFLTILLTMALWRFKKVQVIPNHAFGTRVGTGEWTEEMRDPWFKPVVLGNPSGKFRRMSLLELGKQSRWTEIRKLNRLIKDAEGLTRDTGARNPRRFS